MKVWVVTGPIGAGKSTVSGLLAEHGAAVVDADRLGHEVLNDPALIQNLAEEFGSDCVRNGQVDRQCLGALVFSNQQAMDRLNALTHPALLQLAASRLDKIAQDGNHELAVLEAAVYFLWPPLPMVDMVISVVAEVGVRRRRLMEERSMTLQQVQDRMRSQNNLASLWETADVILDNSFSREALVEAVDLLLRNKLLKKNL